MAEKKKASVLVVDDSSFMLDLISTFLEGSRFQLAGTA
ncbi:MAG: response regulator, partial [Armatimonadetes bacterium CG07_land_8_20_14_0_80_40_9]